jgi:tetratricopeptide (TPR) repeat protein
MKYGKLFFTFASLMTLIFFFTPDCYSQLREYYVSGHVVDKQTQQPLEDVLIKLQHKETSLTYTKKTNKKGEYKFIGIGHGIFKVSFIKDEYQTISGEWDLNTPTDKMIKRKIDPVEMLSNQFFKQMKLSNQMNQLFDQAKLEISKENHAAAIEILNSIISEMPNEANAYYYLGLCQLKTNQVEVAIEQFNKVCQLSPQFPGGYLQLGICYQKLDNLPKALENYEKSLESDPANLIAIYNAAQILYKIDKHSEALQYCQKALAIKPEDAEINEMTGICYIQNEDYAKSLEYLSKARKLYQTGNNTEKALSLDELIKNLEDQIKK